MTALTVLINKLLQTRHYSIKPASILIMHSFTINIWAMQLHPLGNIHD